MIVNQAALANIYIALTTVFNDAFQQAEVWFQKVAMTVPSAGAVLDYKFLLDFPGIREWIGDRLIRSLAGQAWPVFNKDWESTIEIMRNHIADDQIGLYTPIVAQLAFEAKKHPDRMIADLLKNGTAGNCYDGKKFFATNHPVGKVQFSNLDASNATPWYLLATKRPIKPLVYQEREPVKLVSMIQETDENVFMRKSYRYGVDYRGNTAYGLWQLAYCSSQALNGTSFAAAKAAMASFTNADGRPLGIVPDLLVVPPTLEMAGRQLLNAAFVIGEGATSSAMESNVWVGAADLLVVPELA
jgi:phage major head subunit gpT-like protein